MVLTLSRITDWVEDRVVDRPILVTPVTNQRAPISDDQVRGQLKTIVASNGFYRAPRMQRFLSFVVEGRLAGKFHSEDLKESVIGMAVFDRDAGYDPKTDPVVRVEARRLRAKLEEYYDGPGKKDAVRIALPKGSYVPRWECQQSPALAIERLPQQPSLPKKRRWLIPVATAAAIAVLAGVIFLLVRAEWKRSSEGNSASAVSGNIRSLAILPFRNLSGDPGKEYLADGLTDELTTELAKIQSLRVISRTSADQYRSTSKHLPEIGRELNVDAVVEGTLLSSPNRVRVSAQLIRTTTDTHVWAESYERNGDDFFNLEAEIADSIAEQIGVSLSAASKGAAAAQPTSTEAYEEYLRGRFFWNKRTLDGLEKSIAYYNRAIALDPNYAKAYAALGDSYALLTSYGGPSPVESLTRARHAAEQALRLDSSLAEAHTVLAAVKIDYDWDWEGATREFKRALQLSPGYPTARHWYSLHLTRLGRNKEAEEQSRRALELDPLSLIINTDAGETYYCARKPDQAMLHLRRALELDADFAEAHLVMGKVFELKREFTKAVAEFDTANRLFGDAPNVWALKGHALALSGKREEAQAIARKLEEAATQRYVSGVDIAIVYCGLGDSGKAMKWLDKAYQGRDKGLDIMAADPLFDGCRSDSRFQALLRRLRLI